MNPKLVAAAVAVLFAASCQKGAPDPTRAAPSSTASAAITAAAAPEEPPGDVAKGKALMARFECNRCHEGTGLPAPPIERQCFGCHVKILDGSFSGPKGAEARWHDRVVGLDQAPSLTSSQRRLRRDFIERFLVDPIDLRPNLAPTMPRLAITREEARDIAAYLAGSDEPGPKLDLTGADPTRGRKLIEKRGCASCHAFSGSPSSGSPRPTSAKAGTSDPKQIAPGTALAPDLRFTRDRLRPEAVLAWVMSPKAVKPDTLMPEFPLSIDEARDIVAHLLTTPLAPVELRQAPARLPLLERKVTYDEVSEKVLRRTCWHCHGEADYAKGDGGPGNTGGLGFKGRKINFGEYNTVQGGMVDEKGEFHSLFEEVGGVPRLVRSLLARQQEEAGRSDPQIRGMPLGYPSLAPEEIQLVETWVAQGRPR